MSLLYISLCLAFASVGAVKIGVLTENTGLTTNDLSQSIPGAELLTEAVSGVPSGEQAAFCRLLSKGAIAVVDTRITPDAYLQVLADYYQVPLISTAPKDNRRFTVSVFPVGDTLAEAVDGLLTRYRWKQVALVYSSWHDTSWVTSLSQKVLQKPRSRVFTFDFTDSSAADVLSGIEDSTSRLVVAHGSCAMLGELLRNADARSFTGTGWVWVLVMDKRCDLPLFDGVILAEPLLWPSSFGNPIQLSSESLLSSAMKLLVSVVSNDPQQTASCGFNASTVGQEILEKINIVLERTEVRFVNFLTKPSGGNDTEVIGVWAPRAGYSFKSEARFPGGVAIATGVASSLRGKHLWTCIRADSDNGGWLTFWTQGKPNWANWTRHIPEEYAAGYALAIWEELSKAIGFNYSYRYPRDENWGGIDKKTGKWNGMLGEIEDKQCDIAAAALTLTSVRLAEFDYVASFFDTGLGIVMAKQKKGDCTFCFLSPFQYDVWLNVVFAFVIVGSVVALVNKISPFDHHGTFIFAPHDMERAMQRRGLTKQFRKAYKEATTELNFSNAQWFSLSALFQQGSQQPNSLSGRIVALAWWFGVMMITARYTANLAAVLTTAGLSSGIETVDDLANQERIAYGTVGQSAPHQFFRDSEVPVFERMYQSMSRRKLFIKNEAQGYVKARKDPFAFIFDYAIVEFETLKKPCDLKLIGQLFSRIVYGYVTEKHSPYTDELSTAVLQMKELHIDELLIRKWFYDRSECGEQIEVTGLQSMSPSDMFGVFVVIYAVMAFGAIVLCIEWIVSCVKLKNSVVGRSKDIHTFWDAFKYRIKRINRDIFLYYIPQTVRQSYISLNQRQQIISDVMNKKPRPRSFSAPKRLPGVRPPQRQNLLKGLYAKSFVENL